MLQLAELQARVAQAVLKADAESVAPLLHGGADACTRFRIHARHYEKSLTGALRDKFPATVWLVGQERFSAAARAYVCTEPPRKPCIAEYGATFPAFLEGCEQFRELPYVGAFTALEWAVGRASIAVSMPPLSWKSVVAAGDAVLLDSGLALQPGVGYLRAAWAVGDLFNFHVSGAEAERSLTEGFVLAHAPTDIEVRGCRGQFTVATIASAAFAFREALATGRSVADAAATALERDGTFDAGAGLRDIVAAGLAVGIRPIKRGGYI